MGKIVRFYQNEDGITPVKDFLDSLPGKVAQKVKGLPEEAQAP